MDIADDLGVTQPEVQCHAVEVSVGPFEAV
jgi:hypothetical protein